MYPNYLNRHFFIWPRPFKFYTICFNQIGIWAKLRMLTYLPTRRWHYDLEGIINKQYMGHLVIFWAVDLFLTPWFALSSVEQRPALHLYWIFRKIIKSFPSESDYLLLHIMNKCFVFISIYIYTFQQFYYVFNYYHWNRK